MVQVGVDHEARHDAVAIAFIETVVRPELEDRVARPEEYTGHGHSSWRVPFAPEGVSGFVARVKKMLSPLGYEVEQSHDGGGIYDTIIISWVPKPPVATGRSAVIRRSALKGSSPR
jgi:hypothetical protein